MRVLMLGWEFPPAISGGLGTACEGITRGLAAQGVDVTFVVPASPALVHDAGQTGRAGGAAPEIISVPSTLRPYQSASPYEANLEAFRSRRGQVADSTDPAFERRRRLYRRFPPEGQPRRVGLAPPLAANELGTTLEQEVGRYARRVAERLETRDFDLIHAHDWMTFPAALLLRDRRGWPLVVHVHASEYDRSQARGDARIHAVEQRGLDDADRVVCVSRYTADCLRERYTVAGSKLRVVHNATSAERGPERSVPDTACTERAGTERAARVLFLGRVTRQKGPLLFLEAAARVRRAHPATEFVVVGDGDMLAEAKCHARRVGIEQRVHFTGFLSGAALQRELDRADVFCMPSVSEPFGIAALEAAAAGAAVVVPSHSGVAEVLEAAVKVDTTSSAQVAGAISELIADAPGRLRRVQRGRAELRGLRWERRADSLLEIYRELLT